MKRQRPPLKQTTLGNFFNKRQCLAPKPESQDSAFSENSPPKKLIKTPKKSPIENQENFQFDFDDGFGEEWIIDPLQFDKWTKCIVTGNEIIQKPFQKKITVKNATGNIGHFILRDMWAYNLNLTIGQNIGVLAKLSSNDEWIIDAQNGFLSIDPDNLISSTSLIGAMFCRRKGVLSTVFKDLDGDNRVMTIGNLVHEIFQKALLIKDCTLKNIEKIMDDLLAMPNTIRMLFTCDTNFEDTRKELKIFIPQIWKIIQTFVTRQLEPDGNNFNGRITDIIDIEESVLSKSIGFKGRIDVTAQIETNGILKRMPLEVKTGRASFSNEHRSQVILYTMMLNEIGHSVDSGLLIYVREGAIQEIKGNHSEMRDLILLRNEFVSYVAKFNFNNLPEPIRQINCCKKCPYLSVCNAHVKENHQIREIAPEIDEKHVEYFKKWSNLLLLEDNVENANTNLTITAIVDNFEKMEEKFKYRFKRNSMESTGLNCGNFVKISGEIPKETVYGYLGEIDENFCTIFIDRKLNGSNYVIEGFKSGMLSRYLSNLAMLLDPKHEKLRKLIIEPKTQKVVKINADFVNESVAKILADLNKQQQRAVLRVLSCEDYLLIQGPPGTGKTQTIVAMVKSLLALNRTVLLTAHSHSAVDNILFRLNDSPFLRLGNLANIDQKLHNKSYGKLIQDVKNLKDVENLLMNTPIVATTCLGFDTDLANRRKFDVCIVDESSQVLQPEILKPLFACNVFILVGDEKQLQPVVRNAEARKMGMNESLFQKLFGGNSCITLTDQYRMNSVIMDMANKLTYDGILKSGAKFVANGVLKLTGNGRNWLKRIISANLNDSLLFIDTSEYLINCNNFSTSSNAIEAKLVQKIVNEFLQNGVTCDQIGVMAPYRDQVNKLKEIIEKDVEVSTVDQYQGRDKDCIIFSCTKQNRNPISGNSEILDDERRLCVAITRAKHKLILIGDKITLARYGPFQKFFKHLSIDNVIELKNNENGFSWEFL